MNSRFPVRRSYWVLALLLVLAVPILSTTARRGWYLPPSNHAHYLIDSSKTLIDSSRTKIVPSQILHRQLPLCAATSSVPPHTKMRVVRHVEPESFLRFHIHDVNISLQRRPPPILFL